ncbi:hypothetical protein AOLI_G00098010 [Acnodon oligacanthus]
MFCALGHVHNGVYYLSRMSLETKLRARIEGKPTKSKTLKSSKWFQKKHLLKEKLKCALCHHKMKMVSVTKKDQYIWCCKRAGHGRVSKTIRAGSLFEKSKSSLFSWMQYIYRFSQGLRLRQIDMISDDITRLRVVSVISESMRKDDLEIPGEGRNGSLE